MTPSLTAIEPTDVDAITEKEGTVYCKYTVQSSDLNRVGGGGAQLVVRTTTAEFAAEDG